MADTIRELLVSIGLDADEDAIDKFDSGIESIKGHLSDLATVAVGAFAVLAAGAAALIGQATATGAYAEQVSDQAAALGLTTDAYQELSYVASRYGIDSEKITTILSKLAVDQKAVADGNEEAAATYAALGISIDQVTAAKPEQLFALMADGFGNVADASTRLALASTLFGDRIASQLLPLLDNGSAGLAAMAAEAHELGVVMSADAIASANAFNDQMEVLGAVVTSFRNEIAQAVTPTLSEMVSDLLDWVKVNRDLIASKMDEWVGKAVDAFERVAAAVKLANDLVGGVDGWERLAKVITGLAGTGGVIYVAVKFGLLAASIVETVSAAVALIGGGEVLLGILAAIVATLGQVAAPLLVFEDWLTYLDGGDSVFGRLIERWRESEGVLGALARAVEAYGRVWNAVSGIVSIAFGAIVTAFQPTIDAVGFLIDHFDDFIELVITSFMPTIDLITGGLNLLATGLNAVAGGIEDPTKALGATAGVAAGLPGASTQTGISSQVVSAGVAATSGGSSRYAGSAGTAVNVGGDTITINGIGVTAEEANTLIERALAAKARSTAETFRSAEV